MNQLRFLLQHAVRYRRELAVICLLTLAASFATLVIPWLAGQLLGDAISAAGGANPGRMALLLVAALALMTALNIGAAISSTHTAGRIMADLRAEAFSHAQLLPMEFHDRASQGDTLSILTYEVSNLSRFLTSTLATAPAMLVLSLGSAVLLFSIDPLLAAVIPVLLALFVIALRLTGRHLRLSAGKMREAEALVFSHAESQLEMVPVIKSFAVEDHRASHHAALAEDARQMTFRQFRLSLLLAPLTAFVAGAVAILVILVGGEQVGEGGRTPGELFSFLLYAALLTRPLGGLAEFYGQLQIARGTLMRLQALLTMPVEPGHGTGAALAEPVSGRIEFRDVRFGYSERGLALDGANLAIEAGATVALVGENGAGKSTLVKLLMRFYELDGGQILVDGQDIATIDVQSLRRQIGHVSQQAMLFNGTVRENILFGHPGASLAELEAACDLAQASGMIRDLPQGFDTLIGDHGTRLSGGQRQRIVLARALVGNPPIVVLDEATSMYDAEGESAFIAASRTALSGRTVIVITHRPASLALADRIFLVEQHRVREVDALPA